MDLLGVWDTVMALGSLLAVLAVTPARAKGQHGKVKGEVVRVEQQVDMDITVARMAEVDDLDTALEAQAFQPVDQVRYPGYWHRHVFVDLLRGRIAQGRRQGLAGAPE